MTTRVMTPVPRRRERWAAAWHGWRDGRREVLPDQQGRTPYLRVIEARTSARVDAVVDKALAALPAGTSLKPVIRVPAGTRPSAIDRSNRAEARAIADTSALDRALSWAHTNIHAQLSIGRELMAIYAGASRRTRPEGPTCSPDIDVDVQAALYPLTQHLARD